MPLPPETQIQELSLRSLFESTRAKNWVGGVTYILKPQALCERRTSCGNQSRIHLHTSTNLFQISLTVAKSISTTSWEEGKEHCTRPYIGDQEVKIKSYCHLISKCLVWPILAQFSIARGSKEGAQRHCARHLLGGLSAIEEPPPQVWLSGLMNFPPKTLHNSTPLLHLIYLEVNTAETPGL